MLKRIVYSITPTPQMDDWLQSQASEGFRSVNSVVLELIERARREFEKENAQPAATGQALMTQ